MVMDYNNYTNKFLALLNSEQHRKVNDEEHRGKSKKTLRKLKSKFSDQEYKMLCSSRSSPRKFYGTTKVHKIPKNGDVSQLPVRSNLPNLNTTTYKLSKHYVNLSPPLRVCE